MITLADLKTYLGITASTDDQLLLTLILSATAMIETVIGQGIVSATYTEYPEFVSSEFDLQHKKYLDLNDRPLEVFLNVVPVISVTSVKYGDPQVTLVEGTDYTIDKTTGIITLAGNAGMVYPSLVVTYVAGYATAPYDLQQVCKDIVKELYAGAKGTKGSGTVKSKSVGDLSVSYELGDVAMSKYMTILNRYTSVDL